MSFRRNQERKRVVVGFYSEKSQADRVLARIRKDRFYRSALVSVSDEGKQRVERDPYVVFLFAALLVLLFLAIPLFSPAVPYAHAVILSVVAVFATILLSPVLGLSLSRDLVAEYGARVLPGETMVIVQCEKLDTRYVVHLLQAGSAGKAAVFVIRPYLKERWRHLRQTRELLSAQQLRAYANACAASHVPGALSKPRRSVLYYLRRWESIIEEARGDLAEAVELDQSITPSAEWLLDNSYIIQNHIQEIRRNLPRRYYEILPVLEGEPEGLNLRILRLATELSNKTDGSITAASIFNFLSSYQGTSPLTIAELWTFPLMLRYALVEDLAHQSLRVSRRQHDRERADFWANRLLAAAHRSPDRIPMIFSELSDSTPALAPHFVIRLISQLSEEESVFSAAQRWLESRQVSIKETIRTENSRQTRKQVAIANDVTTLRRFSQLDWREIFESLSLVEAILEQDPIYAASDFSTRDHCRRAIEEVARHSRGSEIEVARRALQLSARAEHERQKNVAYFLIDRGREVLEDAFNCCFPVTIKVNRWVFRHPGLVYFSSVSAALAVVLGIGLIAAHESGAGFWKLLGFGIAAAFPASEVAIQIVNYVICHLIPPRMIPRMSFKSGIPDEFRTLVVVPTMLLTEDSIREEVQRLEVRYLANSEPNLLYALLTDYADAPSSMMPEDGRLLEVALSGIADLNARYNGNRFFLFHRERTWCETEGRWIGWERKRGKLEELNRFLNDEPREGTQFSLRMGHQMFLKGVRFVITLDADTELPHDAALHLVEAMAHPLNRPILYPDRKAVCQGYGIIQPRTVTSLPAATASFFSSIFANAKGTDPYAQAISDLYQDLFGEAIYIGKAIYDVKVFHQVLSGRFPEQTLLSHDLIEGNYLRVGFDSTIVLFEHFPSNYRSFMNRQHRWIRGDWQIWDWLFAKVPEGDGSRERNPLSAVGRWKIFDNLRRSLVAPACVAVLAGSWLMMPNAWFWNVFIGLALLIPALIPIPMRVREGAKGRLFVWRDQWTELLRCVITAALLPYHAWVALDAIGRVWFRRTFSRHNLLQWETAQSVHRRFHGENGLDRRAVVICVATAAFALILFELGFSVWPAAVPYLALWLVSPAVLHWINIPRLPKKKRELTEEERRFLRRTARETWKYFDDLVGPESNWLPPDNSQESIRVEVAYRTSPTNIGFWLLSVMAAHDFGYLTCDRLITSLTASFDTIDRLEKYRGHLLNWYDIKTLEPLHPRYVSSVDSGNFLASLWTLNQGLRELITDPLIKPESLEGIADTLSILQSRWESRAQMPSHTKNSLAELERLCRSGFSGMAEAWNRMRSTQESFDSMRRSLLQATDIVIVPEISYWLEKATAEVEEWSLLADRYFGWVPCLLDMPETLQQSVQLGHIRAHLLDNPPLSLEELADDKAGSLVILEQELDELSEAPSGWTARIRDEIARARREAQKRCDEIRHIVDRLRRLQDGMSLEFLYSPDRKLFAVGEEVGMGPQVSSYYDLLASEARLTSLIAIARGEVDTEHWQALGRPFGLFAGRKVLFSWSGSMFEYLMPLIFTRTFEHSLLHHACNDAVAIQIEYGRSRGVPWGISESAFSALDVNQIYQYRAFGVPELGLKRGLGEDLVIAPYSTALAAMVDPAAAVQNFRKLEEYGMHGPKGFYEAIDFSRESREGRKGAIVYAYMAHHQGMSFLSLDNALNKFPMQRRFHADLRVRAAEALLYEEVPPSRIVSQLSTTEERPLSRMIALPVEGVPGRSSNEKTPIPKVQLLSNGSYSLMVTNSGGGYSRWRDNDVTRWRADTTKDDWGSYCFVRDLDTGEFWSTTYRPTRKIDPDYTVIYYADRVEFRCSYNGIEAITEIVVSPEDDVEVRRICLMNRSDERRRLDLTTYSEIVLAPHAADCAHPAFNKLFVHTEILKARRALLAFRRSSVDLEPSVWAGQVLASEKARKPTFETSRMHFIGRGRSLDSPAAMSRYLSNTSGPVLDPVFCIRQEVTLEPAEKTRLAVVTLAADSRARAEQLIDKYSDVEAADRAFELAWTHSQLNLRFLRIQHEDAQRFQELAASMIYPNQTLRPRSERLRRNIFGQSRLWAFGISGDLPICALVVSDPLDLGTVREVLLAHTFWNERGFKSDLVILNTEALGYDQPLQQRLAKMVQIHSMHSGIDRPGGVFLRSTEHLSGDDFTLILSVARVVIFASRGSLSRQLSARPDIILPPELKAPASAPEQPNKSLPMPRLTYFNGIGGFSPDGREYIIYLEGDNETPAPWINVLANRHFGTLVDDKGQGVAWNINSQMNRINPWHNDPVKYDSSSGVYVRDEETGAYWCAAAAPIREPEPYVVRHGQGYSRIEHNSHGIEHNLVVFVPTGENGGPPLRVQKLELRNSGSRKRRLSVTFYTEWTLGRDREETQMHVFTSWDPVSWALLARNSYNTDFSNYVAFAAVRPGASSYTADRTEFLGRNGSATRPASLGRRFLGGRTGGSLDPCAALQVQIELEPGEERDVVFLLGQAMSIQEVRSLIEEYGEIKKVNEAFHATKDWWDQLLGTIQVETPERSVDFLLNRWLLYQTLSCRIWGRTALYQSGGAFGFRDQLQDVMAMVYSKPDLAREHIIRAAARQFVEGDVQHWWHPQSGAGVRTRCSDDLLWLPYVTEHYVRITGDRTILDERIPFLECQPLKDNEHEIYSVPSVSMTDGTLFEHCRRAIEKGFTTGEHGLPLIGLCDWNDGLNRVGIEGKGESIWLGWFLIEVLRSFAQLCRWTGQNHMVELCNVRIDRLKSAIELNGWDGDWYRRAYFDDGSPLGSSANLECRIDSLAQSWAVISGSGAEEMVEQALASVEEHLVRDQDRLILLFTPAFQHSERNPGYIRAYPPGVRENGGQYTHAAVWVAMAFARQGNGSRAAELLRMLNPIELTKSPADISRYKCEPYVVAGDVYSLEGHVGRGGWTWYTGSSSWMYRAWVEEVLGLRLRENTLTIDPVIPSEWPGYTMVYTRGNSRYRISVENPEKAGRGVAWVELDGTRLPGASIELTDDGKEHRVQVRLGLGTRERELENLRRKGEILFPDS